jgi:hypothetical protein
MMTGSRAHARFAGAISGTITDATTTNGISNITVFVANAQGNPISSATAFTDINGHYTTNGDLPDGTYFVSTGNQQHYINEAGGNLQCPFSCNLAISTPAHVIGGVATMDFQLALGGTITGSVTNGTTGLAGVFVEIVDAGNQFLASVGTDSVGTFTTSSGLPNGTYFAKTDVNGTSIPPASQGYINQLYNGVPCLTAGCPTTSATPIVITNASTASGVTFTLVAGARFSGRVTEASSPSTGIPNVTVDVLNAANQIVSLGQTDASGNFETVAGVQAGSYTLRTLGSGGHINKFNDGTLCIGSFCASQTVTPIAVTSGALHAGVDFSLDQGAVFSGTLTEQGTGNPVNGLISVLGTSGTTITSVQTGPFTSGNYTTTDGVPPGTYFLRTTNFDGHIDQIYSGVTCNPTCTVNNGTPIAVAGPGTVSGKDFSLAQGGRITGTITQTSTPNPISGVTVSVSTASGAVITSMTSQPNGTFITPQGLPNGQYFLRTSNSQGFINELYPNVPCIGTNCPAAGGTAVVISGIANVVANMDLSPGGRISGHIMEGPNAVPGALANVLDSTGLTISSGQVDGLGAYISGAGLPTGSYLVRTTNSAGDIDELYLNVPCGATCNLAVGSPVNVTSPSTTPGIDFDLAQGGQISGTVTTGGSTPLPNVSVQVFNPNTSSSLQSTTDSNGNFVVKGLSSGTYYVRTNNSLGYINETYDDIPCVFQCTSTTLGTPQVISGQTMIPNVNFDLVAGGRVSGLVTDQSSSLPIANVQITVVDPSGATVSTGTTDLTGHYTTQAGIAAGTYYVRTSNSLGYLNEIYNDVLCTGACTLTTGATISVSLGATTSGINFGLVSGGRISGTVTDASSALPLQSVTVQAVDSGGRVVATGLSDANGQYVIGAGLPTGPYFLRTSNNAGYIDELYDDKPCPLTCTVTTGTVVQVTSPLSTPNRNFALTRGGRVSGQVFDADHASQPIASVSVQIMDATGRVVATGSTNSFGSYTTFSGLPTGTYFARTANGLGYINQLYNGHDCFGNCVVSGGDAISVTAGSVTSGVSFGLHAGGRIAGNIATSGSKLGVTVQVYDGTGTFVTSAITNAVGDYVTTAGLAAGTYYARTFNIRGLINQLYMNLPCSGTCTVTNGAPIVVTAANTTSGIDFVLADGARFSGTVARTSPPGALSNVLVEIYDGLNRVATGVTDSSGNYVTGEGVVGGSYFARTQNQAGFVNQIYNGVDCSVSCVATSGTSIVATAPNISTGINFTLTLDPDSDGDGIVNTIDVSPAAFSNDFTDLPQGGTTMGTVAVRDTWAIKVFDVSPGGVQFQISGAGANPAAFDTCSTGGSERVELDVAGEAAQVSCISGPGSTFARAIVASPTIELRDPPTGAGLTVLLTTGQAATIGSPVVASPANTEPITVKIIGNGGQTLGTFDLDPGESVDAVVHADNSVAATVLVGTVTITVGDNTETASQGDPVHNFPAPGITFTGFFAPVSNPPAVNMVNPGNIVPLSFSLGGNHGLAVLQGTPTSQRYVCATGTPAGSPEPIDVVGALSYDAGTDRYTINWRTRLLWIGSCRQLTLKLSDGSVHTALFQFKLFEFVGFFPPILNKPFVNLTRAGSQVPVIFSLLGDQGLNIFTAGSPRSRQVSCTTAAPIGSYTPIDTNGGLDYNPFLTLYSLFWKTNPVWSNTCRELSVDLSDGSSHTALFRFR